MSGQTGYWCGAEVDEACDLGILRSGLGDVQAFRYLMRLVFSNVIDTFFGHSSAAAARNGNQHVTQNGV